MVQSGGLDAGVHRDVPEPFLALLDPQQLIEGILCWSALPSASRALAAHRAGCGVNPA
ncbi:MAG TPA: hypothetical protein VGQ88_04985 [Burkholderiales bacterium]|nr:hypothetical protein [Burkholderiales bacterium]